VNYRDSFHRPVLVVAFVIAFAPLLIRAQEQAQSAAPPKPAASGAVDPKTPRPITLEDYPRFKRLANQAISTDGKWMLYTVTPNEGDGTLFVQSLDTTTKYEIPRGTNASFSDNARWVAYFIPPPTATGRGGRGGRGAGGGRGDTPAQGEGAAPQAPPRAFEVLDLTNGTKTQYPAVESFSFSPDGEWLLLRPKGATPAPAAANAAAGRGGRGGAAGGNAGSSDAPGTDLLMKQLATGAQRYVGNVGSYAFDDAGKLLAYTVRGQQKLGNGVYVMTLASGDQKMLDAAASDYDALTWSQEGTNLAVLRGEKPKGKVQKENVLLAWRNAASAQPQLTTFDPSKASAMPAGMVVSEFTAPRWSTDGARVLVGLKEQETEKPASTEPQANVDVWHWKDDDP
jgi:hypothetical protein